MEKRNPMPLESGIAHFATQSEAVRQQAREVLAEAGATVAYRVPRSRYVGFENAFGETVAYLYANYITITERAKKTPSRNPALGRPSTSTTAEDGNGWDIYLGGWKPAKAPRPRPSAVTKALGIDYCPEQGCTVWIPKTARSAYCRKHAFVAA